MKIKRKVIVLFTIFIMFFLCLSLYSQDNSKIKGQQVKANKIKLEMKKGVTKSIVKGGSKASPSNKSEWAKLILNYSTLPSWADEVTIRFSVLLYNKYVNSKKNDDYFTMITGDVTYINVEKGDHVGEMFIHPNTLKRYGEIKEIRAELIYNGNSEDEMYESFSSSREKEFLYKWWTKFKPKYNELLNKFFVPFVHDGDNANETIKLS